MKKRILFLAAASAMLSLAACTKDGPIADGTDDSGSKVQGYITIKITSPETRTSGSPTEDGIGTENDINSVTAVFTDNTGVIQHVKATTIATGTTTEPFTVEVGTYKLYVLINNPSSNSLIAGDNIQRIVAVATAEEAEEGFSSGNFFMVNARHNGTEEAGVDVTIDEINIQGNPFSATVSVDRVAVKIRDSSPQDFAIASSPNFPANVANLHVEGFTLLNINREMNLVQEWGEENVNGVALTPPADVLQTPLYPAGTTDLVKDQYFRNISEYTTITRDGNNDIIEITDIAKDISPSPFTPAIKYATENRPTIIINALNLTAGSGETTGVIYKVIAQDGTNTPVSTFYAYREKFYTDLGDIETEYSGIFAPGELTNLQGNPPALRAKGVKVYEDGVMYYTYFIRDPNPVYQYDLKDYYGTFRNSIYNLIINGFSNIGDDVPGGGRVDPEQPGEPGNPPIDLNEAYIDVVITINLWVLNTIGIDF